MKSFKEIAEALKGEQHKIDKNKNGKIDAHDFKLLRKEEADLQESVDRIARSDYKVNPSGRKSHKEIVFKDGSENDDQLKREEHVVREGVNVGDKVHLGVGTKGGAGYKGIVHKIDGEIVHVNVGSGKWGDKIVKGHISKLTKEEVETGEETHRDSREETIKEKGFDMNEEMTDAQKAERERLVKGMKKNLAGFKTKYGGRAKDVMYATATKLAKEEVQLDEVTFDSAMHSAIAAHHRGNHSEVKRHLENAGSAFYFLRNKEITKHKDLIDKYRKLINIHKMHEEVATNKNHTEVYNNMSMEKYTTAISENSDFRSVVNQQQIKEETEIEESTSTPNHDIFFVFDKSEKDVVAGPFSTKSKAESWIKQMTVSDKLNSSDLVVMTEKEISKKLGINLHREEVELNELSGGLLGRYIQKARSDVSARHKHNQKLDSDPKVAELRAKRSEYYSSGEYTKSGESKYRKQIDKLHGDIEKRKKKLDPEYPKSVATGKRHIGIEKAFNKLRHGKLTNEELDEANFAANRVFSAMRGVISAHHRGDHSEVKRHLADIEKTKKKLDPESVSTIDKAFNKLRPGKLTNEELDEAAKTGNKGRGYHGEYHSENADEIYSAMHTKVKKIAGEAGHLRDVKKPNVMVKHYLDSQHGRHLAGNEHDHDYIKKDFGAFKKNYKPELHEECVDFDEEGTLMSEKITFNDFIAKINEQLLEYETDGSGVYRHTKKSTYGKSYQGDDDENEKPKNLEPEVKRGRGRPTGSYKGTYKARSAETKAAAAAKSAASKAANKNK